MSRARTWRSNNAGRKINPIGSRRLQPISSVATSPGPYAPNVAAFLKGLAETGWVDGQNVAIEYRWAENHNDRLPAFAADLVGRKVDVIVAGGGLVAVLAAKSATSTIPIVFPAVSDPVAAGLVASFARPGGNLTGFSPFQFELMPKRLEVLTELVPRATVIALLVSPNDPRNVDLMRDLQETAHAKGLQLHTPARTLSFRTLGKNAS